MKTPGATSEVESLYEARDVSGAGCVRVLFGLTFALGLFFALGGVGGFAQLLMGGDLHFWPILPTLGGVAMMTLGGVVAFGRARRFCTAEAFVSEWRLGPWRRLRRVPLDAFSEVRVRRIAGPDFSTFVVSLWGQEAERDVCTRMTPGEAMNEAVGLARIVKMGVRDQSFAQSVWRSPEELQKPPWEVFVGAEDPGLPPQGELRAQSPQRVTVPARGLSSVGGVVLGLSALLAALGLFPAVLAMALGSFNGELLCGLCVLAGLVAPLWGWALVWPVLKIDWTRRELTADDDELHVASHLFRRSSHQRVAWLEVEQIEHISGEAKRRTAGARLQDGDVLVRTPELELRLGAGLDDEALEWLARWLRHQVARAVERRAEEA